MADTESSSPEATKGPWSSKENRRVAAASAAVDTFARNSCTEGCKTKGGWGNGGGGGDGGGDGGGGGGAERQGEGGAVWIQDTTTWTKEVGQRAESTHRRPRGHRLDGCTCREDLGMDVTTNNQGHTRTHTSGHKQQGAHAAMRRNATSWPWERTLYALVTKQARVWRVHRSIRVLSNIPQLYGAGHIAGWARDWARVGRYSLPARPI